MSSATTSEEVETEASTASPKATRQGRPKRGSAPTRALTSVPAERAAPSTEVIDATVHRLCALQEKARLDLVLAIGRIVVEDIYGGDLEHLRSRDRKLHSLRSLAAHPDLPFSATTLYYSVNVYELTERLGGVHAREHLTATHYRLALAVPEEQQADLLNSANEQRWTTRQLEEEASRLQKRVGRSGGRPPLRGVVKAVGALHRVLETRKEDLLDFGDIETLGTDEAHELFSRVMDVAAELERVKEALRPLMGERTIEPDRQRP